jgi:hypothetical protein
MAAIYYFFTSYWWRHANIVNCKKLSLSVNTVYHNTVIVSLDAILKKSIVKKSVLSDNAPTIIKNVLDVSKNNKKKECVSSKCT